MFMVPGRAVLVGRAMQFARPITDAICFCAWGKIKGNRHLWLKSLGGEFTMQEENDTQWFGNFDPDVIPFFPICRPRALRCQQ